MNWQQKQLGDIASIITGWTPPPRNTENYGNEILFVSPADLGDKKYIFNTKTKLSTQGAALCQIFPANTILYVCIGSTIGKCGIASTALTSNQQINAVIPSPNYCSEFLYYSLLNESQKIKSQATEQAVPIINKSNFAATPINLPPLAEQIEIATALASIDALLAKLDQLIAKKRDIKQAAMQELLTGRRRLPGFSGGWTVAALRNLGAWKGGATPPMANPDFWVNGDVPWASSGDIKSTTIDATAKNITELAVESSSTTVVPAGSVVMVTRSGVLRRYFPVAKTSKPIAINQDIKALIPASGVDSEFVLQSLLLHGPDILSSCMKAGTTVESVELSWLKAYEIDLPSLDEQQAIAALLRDMAAEITALEARQEKTRLIKQGMMQELLSGRVRLI